MHLQGACPRAGRASSAGATKAHRAVSQCVKIGGERTKLLETPTHAPPAPFPLQRLDKIQAVTMPAAVECGGDAIQTSKYAGAHNAGKYDFFRRQLFK